MSALRDGEPIKMGTKTVSSFRQPVPIPSYLVALVVGDLQSRQIGPRSHIWAEPDCLDAAAYEFADVGLTSTKLTTWIEHRWDN